MIQLTDVFCVLFRYTMGPVVSDYNKRLILLSAIQLSGGHCKSIFSKIRTHTVWRVEWLGASTFAQVTNKDGWHLKQYWVEEKKIYGEKV